MCYVRPQTAISCFISRVLLLPYFGEPFSHRLVVYLQAEPCQHYAACYHRQSRQHQTATYEGKKCEPERMKKKSTAR